MSLLVLPNELILLIAEILPMKDVNSLHRTNHHLACLTTSILHRFAVQERSSYGMIFPPLHWAAWKGHVSLAKLLLDKDFEIDAKTREHGKTALQCAAWQGHERVIRLLLDRGAAIDECDNKYGKSALHQAAIRGYEPIVRLLLERGADVGIKDHTGQTALIWLTRSQSRPEPLVNILRLLLEAGADKQIDAQEFEKGETALHWAVWKEHFETVKLFREWGASICIKSKQGETAVDWARQKGNNVIEKLLVGGYMVDLEYGGIDEGSEVFTVGGGSTASDCVFGGQVRDTRWGRRLRSLSGAVRTGKMSLLKRRDRRHVRELGYY